MSNRQNGRERISGNWGFGRKELRFPIPKEAGGFGEKRVLAVAETIRSVAPDIKKAMRLAGIDSSLANDIVDGEYGRIMGLGRAYWPFFYGLPFVLMNQAGHHVNRFFEKGPSLEAHLAAMDPFLQPAESKAVDFPHIAAGATESVHALQRQVLDDKPLLRQDGIYHVSGREEDISSTYIADLSGSMLEAQYEDWGTLVRSLLAHSNTATVGDVLHGLVKIPGKKIGKDGSVLIPFNTSSDPDTPTGFQLKLGQEQGQYQDRKFVRYQLARDRKMIGEGHAIRYLETSDRQEEGVCTILTDSRGQEYVQAWAYVPKEGAAEADLRKVFMAEETLHDLYANTEHWDGNGAMGVLHEFKRNGWGRREKQMDTLVATQIPSPEGMSGRLPLTILARNKEQLLECLGRNELRHIGEDKTFKTVDDFLQMVQNDLMGRIDTIATFYPPPLLDIIASRDGRVIKDIAAAVR